MDALYVPVRAPAGVDSFSVVLLKAAEASPDHVVDIQGLAGGSLDLEYKKNVVLAMAPRLTPARRERLLETLESL